MLKTKFDDLRKVVGIITGHCNLNHHLHMVGTTDRGLCQGCLQEEKMVEHMVFNCATKIEGPCPQYGFAGATRILI